MLGQLQDAGNTTTLAHYLRLLESAFLVSGLEKFSSGGARSRGSSPKLLLWNNGLSTALTLLGINQVRADSALWGRLVENAVGAHLVNALAPPSYEMTYWRERDDEVDYVVRGGRRLWAIEVKSGRPGKRQGLAAFRKRHPEATPLVVGSGGLPLEDFFSTDPDRLLAGN